MTRTIRDHRELTRPNFAVPCSHRQIYLGNVHRQGVTAIHRSALRAILGAGRVAVFIGANGESAAYSYRHIDYDRHCRKHADSLVGVYQPEPSGEFPYAGRKSLLADIRCHVLALPNTGAKAA